MLQRVLHWYSQKNLQVCQVHLWPLLGNQWQTWEEGQWNMEWDDRRGKPRKVTAFTYSLANRWNQISAFRSCFLSLRLKMNRIAYSKFVYKIWVFSAWKDYLVLFFFQYIFPFSSVQLYDSLYESPMCKKEREKSKNKRRYSSERGLFLAVHLFP